MTTELDVWRERATLSEKELRQVTTEVIEVFDLLGAPSDSTLLMAVKKLQIEHDEARLALLSFHACKMDAPGGPTCWCDHPSVHENGLCDLHGKKAK